MQGIFKVCQGVGHGLVREKIRWKYDDGEGKCGEGGHEVVYAPSGTTYIST